MHVGYSSEPVDIDDAIVAAEQETPGEIKLRIPVLLARKKVGAFRRYMAWPGVSWVVKCASVDEARALRETLEALFHAISLIGFDGVKERLTTKLLSSK